MNLKGVYVQYNGDLLSSYRQTAFLTLGNLCLLLLEIQALIQAHGFLLPVENLEIVISE